MEKLLLTVDETAEMLNMTRWKVFELVRRGDLVSAKIGGLRRVPTAAVHEYVEAVVHPDSGAA